MRVKSFFGFIFILVFSGVLFQGCTNSSSSNNKYICDYHNVVIPDDEYQIPSSDLRLALEMYANLSDQPLSSLSEEQLMRIYDVNSLDELKSLAIYNMVEHRIVEYVYSYITENSSCSKADMVKCKNYISRLESITKENARLNDQTYESFVNEIYGVDIDSYISTEEQKMMNLCISERILQLEGIVISDEDIQAEYSELSEEYGVSIDELKERILPENVEMEITYENIYSLLKGIYQQKISNAYDEQARNLKEIGFPE